MITIQLTKQELDDLTEMLDNCSFGANIEYESDCMPTDSQLKLRERIRALQEGNE